MLATLFTFLGWALCWALGSRAGETQALPSGTASQVEGMDICRDDHDSRSPR